MIPSEAREGPTPFGKYLLDREIARGGMARVHLARLRGLGGFEKRLVVKQILPALASDPRFVEMFVEEAKTLVQMSHPHVVPVYELGVVDGVYFLAMEYVEGATLADVLGDGPLEPAEAVHAGVQICDALSYAHERFTIVHRDVTPRNVIIDAAGHCRLLDFGIAAPATDEAGGMLFGTPGYLSPEQARGEAIAASSDLYSLGAVLWHALTGKTPEGARTIDEARALVPGADRPALPPEIDPELAQIVERALDPDPSARWSDARALGRSLRGWLAARKPEGVAPELGARAERARLRRDRARASERPPPTDEPGTAKIARTPSSTSDRVEVLAQSRALEAIIAGTPETQPAPIESEAIGTIPLAGRSGRHAASRQEPPRNNAVLWVVGALGSLVVGIVVLGIMTTSGTAHPAATPLPEPPRVRAPAPRVETPIEREPVVPETPPEAPPEVAPPAVDPAPAPARFGTITIAAHGTWAEIRVDNRVIGTTPIRSREIAAGTHTITASNPNVSGRATTRVTVRDGARLSYLVDLEAGIIAER